MKFGALPSPLLLLLVVVLAVMAQNVVQGQDGAGNTTTTAGGDVASSCNAGGTLGIENVPSPMTLIYEVGMDEASGTRTFTGQVVYEGLGWVAFGISETGQMIGSLGIIGLPDEPMSESNPGKYNMEAIVLDGIVLTDQQTLMDANIVQNETHTVLTFTKFLEEPGEIAIDANGGDNSFLVAAGYTNDLNLHRVRQSFNLNLGCQESEPALAVGDDTVGDTGGDMNMGDSDAEDGVTDTAEDTSAAAGGGVSSCNSGTVAIENVPVPMTLTYELGMDETSGMGTFTGQVVYEGLGWVSFGISETGGMIGSLGIIGLPDKAISESNPGKYTLNQYVPAGIVLTDQQTLMDANIVQNDTHTVLTFTKFLEEPGEIAIDANGGDNSFLVAAGFSNDLTAHRARQAFSLNFGCEESEPASADGDEISAAVDDSTNAPATTGGDATPTGPVDCSEFQASHVFDGLGLTLNYVVNVDEATGEGNFSGQVVYEGQGWVSLAFSDAGSMVGSLSVIGVPDQEVSQTNPGKYFLGGQSISAVTLTDQQTLLDGNIEQNETHTVLTFTKLLMEPGEIEINPQGFNFFLAAAGIENSLGMHAVRGAVELGLSPCTAEGGGASGASREISSDRKESSFRAHGWLTTIAWGILVPLAIGNSLCRHLIPVQGLWYEAHRALNSLAIVMTVISFAIVVNALEKTSPNPNHFQPIEGGGALGKHKTIGLVVFILSLVQGIGGVMRPHLPKKNDDGSDAEPKSAVRTVWEYAHKGSGVAILAMAWYQCHSGLVIYANNFQAKDYTDVFWGVTGAISAIVVVGALTKSAMPAKDASHSPVPAQEIQDVASA